MIAVLALLPVLPAYSAVYDWTQAPLDQKIPIAEASFDRGGYLLRTASGDSIVVPYTGGNLYVMRFVMGTPESMSLENTGRAPVLAIGRDGYLANATVPGARWYPFTHEFQPQLPVYAGIAPSWADFIAMSWYPGMTCYGSYWTDRPYRSGAMVIPAIDAQYQVDGRTIDGWSGFHAWNSEHPGQYHTAYADASLYRRVYSAHRFYAHRRERRFR